MVQIQSPPSKLVSQSPSAFLPEGYLVTQTSVGSSRLRSQGGLVHLVNGCRGDTEFGGDRVDRVLGDVAVYPTVGGGSMARCTRPRSIAELHHGSAGRGTRRCSRRPTGVVRRS